MGCESGIKIVRVMEDRWYEKIVERVDRSRANEDVDRLVRRWCVCV